MVSSRPDSSVATIIQAKSKKGNDKMKRSMLLYLLFFVLITQSVLTAQTKEIWGYVYNVTNDSALIPNTEVQFLVYRGHSLIDDSSYVKKTNSNGKYRLISLPDDSSLTYYPRVNFIDITYYGAAVRFTKKQSKFQGDVVVYDTTADKRNIFTSMEHLFLSHENGKILVKEIFLLQNRGKRTYMGNKRNRENVRLVLEFQLPVSYENLEILTPESQNYVYVENNTLYESNLFSPGTKQFSYQFQIPYSNTEWKYQRPIVYPIGGVNIFIEDPQLTVEGPGVKPMGDFNIKGKTYQYYSLQHLMPGMQLDLTLTKLPAKTIDIKWIILIVAVVFLVVGFGYTFLKK